MSRLNKIVIICVAVWATAVTARMSHIPQQITKIPGKIGSNLKTVAGSINDYLAQLPPEDEWATWITEHGPKYGNYCGPNYGDATYEKPCLSRLDCICKAHDFGYSLRKYLEADAQFVQEVLKQPLVANPKNPEYESFLQVMTATLFAGKIAGENFVAQIEEANRDFKKDPQKASKTLNDLIDENQVFRDKIDSINRERLKFEELGANAEPPVQKPKDMSLAIRPFSLFFGTISVEYEIRLNSVLSLRIPVSVLTGGVLTSTYLNYLNSRTYGTDVGVGLKWFFVGEALKNGIYLEPRITGSYESVPVPRTDPSVVPAAFALTPAVLVGFDKVFALGFHFDAGLGVGYHFAFPFTPSAVPQVVRLNGIVPEAQASIGWAW